MINNIEIWKDIQGYEGFYQVSNLGRIRSLDRTITDSIGRKRLYKGRILKQMIDGSGYFEVLLYKETNRKPLHIQISKNCHVLIILMKTNRIMRY